MIDIHEQKTFDLDTETKDLVLADNVKHPLVKKINETLGGLLQKDQNEPFTTYHTMGKLKAKRIHVARHEDLEDETKRNKIFNKITSLKGELCVLIDTFEGPDYLTIVQDLSERILTANYSFDLFKSKVDKEDKNFHYYGETNIYHHVFKGYVFGEMINKCRDLVNTPYNHLNAEELANYAKLLERYDNITVTIYNKKQIESMNMGAYLGVNKGSSDEPRLILIQYQGKDDFDDPVALVGKGVMYDTGGYSLKTPTGMPGMKGDMAGGAAVISAIEAIAKLKLPVNVMSIVAATDNRIGDGAIVPDDILKAANGKTIEIISTDAEGRLTLADAVWFAQQQGARKIIDVATLTGSMVRALGKEYTGAFTNDKEFLNELMEASKKTNEPLWEMPINKGYHKLLESKVADMKNTGGPLAGASVAAAFIENFIDDGIKWIHLDIAGTSSSKDHTATGVMVKTFTELFDNN